MHKESKKTNQSGKQCVFARLTRWTLHTNNCFSLQLFFLISDWPRITFLSSDWSNSNFIKYSSKPYTRTPVHLARCCAAEFFFFMCAYFCVHMLCSFIPTFSFCSFICCIYLYLLHSFVVALIFCDINLLSHWFAVVVFLVVVTVQFYCIVVVTFICFYICYCCLLLDIWWESPYNCII